MLNMLVSIGVLLLLGVVLAIVGITPTDANRDRYIELIKLMIGIGGVLTLAEIRDHLKTIAENLKKK